MKKKKIIEQIRDNMVALISLVIAITSLGYSSWRNETSEENRNRREAAFIVLQELGELQQSIDYRYYSGDKSALSHYEGWAQVVLIQDLSNLISDDINQDARQLFSVWEANSDQLESGENGIDKIISKEVFNIRQSLLTLLKELQ